jgi:hypothetical protein
VITLSCGLVWFVGLVGYGLARGAPGLAPTRPAGIVVLLVGLTALGWVWSNRSVRRESVEYTLQCELAAHFKSSGNPRRAAIHEHKAGALKPQ